MENMMTDKNTSIVYAGGTDRGKVRQQNQDSILMSEFEHSNAVLLLVADGVGGHKGGEVASKLAVDTIQAYVAKAILQAHSGGGYGSDWLSLTLKHAIADANLHIMEQQKLNFDLNNMATTIVAMLIHDNEVAISHLGDSRCYQYSQQLLKQVTEDHTMLQKMLNEGKINQHEFEIMPMHHMISQAIGLVDDPDIQANRLELNQNRIYLLCSDGLTNCVSDEQIKLILEKNECLETAVDELITRANDNGGVDNISVIIVKSEVMAN
ncbi:MAG: Stp1/IreP family PP2C-type Ser/Thr phosphatase [endosymbiont of Galathealinum brachiosum]|uniref:Stp1/IreP family PP2C-type Ser/Thr phosphatase n=1 Tax=endosymbiont of Galathealinum brachiosum TaxID=2200906 RepID=A0A370DKB3_9GAMM|nr:MAG: Stp1/IreP family PP2C-type Ser/Thr phosphatase [endosymbiont of Galathealinum brachiosum]